MGRPLLVLAGLAMTPWPAGRAEEAPAWPEAEVGERTAARVQAGKKAAKHLACDICHMRVTGLLLARADEDGGRWPASGSFRAAVGEAKVLCEEGPLLQRLHDMSLTLRLDPDSDRAFLERAEDGDSPWLRGAGEPGQFNWKAFAAHHACLEVFRKNGDKIAAGVREALGEMPSAGATEAEEGERLSAVAWRGCARTKVCKASLAERELDAALGARDQALLARDPSYEPSPSDYRAPKSVKYEADVNYYAVLGVEDVAPCSEAARKAEDLLLLYGTEEGRALGGVADVFADTHAREAKAARLVLCDRGTRRQYDRDRHRAAIQVRHGLRKAKPDRPHLDGAAMLLAYEEEVIELRKRKAKRSEL